MLNSPRTSAELLSDSALYRRTPRGQRALQRGDVQSTPALRILARLNGCTDVRRLVELSADDARDIVRVIPQLFAEDLIEFVNKAEPAA